MIRYWAGVVSGIILSVTICAGSGWAQRRNSEDVEALRAESFAILPWDQMRALGGASDKVHGLASLRECNFTYAGFPRVEDLPACERLGLRAIVYPDDSLGLTNPQQLSDDAIEKAVRKLAESTRRSPACVGYFLRDEPGASQFAYLAKIVAAI